jgi:hypothetical protein
MSLGDRWGAEVAPVETNPVTVEYWRQKANEFQVTMNAVDTIAQESWALASVLPEGPQLDAIMQGLQEMEGKRATMKIAAEGINAAAAVINAAGGRFPVLSLPPALGLPPLAIPAAAVGAFTVAASLVAWAVGWTRVQAARIGSSVTALDAIGDPEVRAQAAAEVALIRARAEAAAASAESPLASIANIVKWVGIGALAFFAFRAFQSTRGKSAAE